MRPSLSNTNPTYDPDYRPHHINSHCTPTHNLFSGAPLNSSHIICWTVSPVWPISYTLFGAKWAPTKTLWKTAHSRVHGFRGLVGHCPLCSALTLSAQMDLDIYFDGGEITSRNLCVIKNICLTDIKRTYIF